MAQQDDVNVPQVLEVSLLGILVFVVLVIALQALYFVSDAGMEAEKSTREMPEVYRQSIDEQRTALTANRTEKIDGKDVVLIPIQEAMSAVVKELQAKKSPGEKHHVP